MEKKTPDPQAPQERGRQPQPDIPGAAGADSPQGRVKGQGNGMTGGQPGLTGIMGDIHGNTRWAIPAIRQICARLPGENPKIILQAGDFGFTRDDGTFLWAGEIMHRQTFLEAVTETLEAEDAYLWACEGNHEDHGYLAELLAGGNRDDIWPTPRVRWLPRGTRWKWHDRVWLAAGGAVSVDKLLRTEGISWFPEETITPQQEAAIIAGGPADVLLSHDAPADAPLNLSPRHLLPKEWKPMIPAAEKHRDVLQRICVAVKPSYVFHGHYHLTSLKTVRAAWGTCRFTALDKDGTQHNWGILDTRTMEWDW
jgi:Calcineurin-like phosphoesterase